MARQPIVGGNSEPSLLALSSAQRLSIGALVPNTSEEALCTGVLVAADWVLSSRHCEVASQFTFTMGADRCAPIASRVSVDVASHPTLDLLLVRLQESRAPASQAAALPLLDEALDERWIGSGAQLAGFGLDEADVAGRLAFVAETISSVDQSTVQVNGEGRTGACSGDSGGPLLLADRAGAPRIAGILSQGSESCHGSDVYTRVDIAEVRQWIADHIAGTPTNM